MTAEESLALARQRIAYLERRVSELEYLLVREGAPGLTPLGSMESSE